MTNSVAVVTGGAGALGLATAKALARDHHVVLSDVNKDGLVTALDDLCRLDVSAESVATDVTDRGAVEELLAVAGDAGRVTAVVHTASVDSRTADPRHIVRVNALGTIHVTRATLAVADPGTALVNVAGTAGHTPAALVGRPTFRRAFTDPEDFAGRLARLASTGPARRHAGAADALSKAFVAWYSARMTGAFVDRGARILSVSPGESAPDRLGDVAELLAFCAGDRPGLLSGVDIVCDGGTSARLDLRARLTR